MSSWVRPVLVLVGVSVLALANTHESRADLLWFDGTLSLELATGAPFVDATGQSVALINNSAGLGHLFKLDLFGGISGSGTVPITDPDIVASFGLLSLSATVALGTGKLYPISGGGPLSPGKLPVLGELRLCVFVPGCSVAIPGPLTVNGTRGVGIGGPVTLGGSGIIRVTLNGAPWTIGTALAYSEVSSSTANGFWTMVTHSRFGFAHGPASLTSSTATTGGVIQLVTPISVHSNTPKQLFPSMFGILRLRFIPEPSALAMLLAGGAFLATVGRRRMRP